MNVTDGIQFTGISASTAPFRLKGGRYVLAATATFGGGSIAVQMLMHDGATWVTPLNIAGSANTLTAAGTQVVDLPPGQYKIVIVTASAVTVSLSSIPI